MGAQLMRIAVGLIAALALAACGSDEDAALDSAATAETMPAEAAAAGECAPRLTITGLCGNADPSQFLKINTQLPKLANECVWRTQEVGVSDTLALLFRAQDCSAAGWVPNVYEYVQGYVKYRMDGTPGDQAMFILEVIPVPDGETPEQVAMKTLDKAPENQRDRCHTLPVTGPVVAGATFELAPAADLAAEMDMNAGGEPWDACGPNGVTMDAQQFWEGRNGYALFHMLGQDDPQWDPASFTFYRKGADGVWVKAG
jgi:hypothetical protein